MEKDSKMHKLAEWSASDFAGLYAVYNPSLVGQAQGYVGNVHVAEEIVQDAFLFLMTSLPELETEDGVIKFLRWKTKMLCFDYLRKRKELSVDKFDEFELLEEDISAELERAEDAAIINLALAKLNDRHRRVLYESTIEGKGIEEIASGMGMTANGVRQLIFRARRAFRVALVGEAEIQGKTASEILSIAARHSITFKNATIVGTFLVLGLSLGPIVTTPSLPIGEMSAAISASQESRLSDLGQGADDTVQGQVDDFEQDSQKGSDELPPATSQTSETSGAGFDNSVGLVIQDAGLTQQQASDPVENPSLILSSSQQDALYATGYLGTGMYTNSKPMKLEAIFEGTPIEVFGGTGVSAFLDLSTDNAAVRNLVLQFRLSEEVFFGLPAQIDYGWGEGRLRVVAAEFQIVDENFNLTTSNFTGSASVEFALDSEGYPIDAEFGLIPTN